MGLPIRKILIANRGEIAVRIIRTCREMDITTVTVFSDEDRNALHVRLSDEAYALTGSSASDTYLNQEKILACAKESGADAIHPGYGFLSENPAFAERAEREGLVFIGPKASAIRLMGDKLAARKHALSIGVPVAPGTANPLTDHDAAATVAAELGYPVLLKAAAGGGGKGMRVVRSAGEMTSQFRLAQSESTASFGSGRLYIEKYFESPKHIEAQVIADEFGNVAFLGERECSIQRRHQKVIEETPSAAIDESLRRALGDAAIRLVSTSKYTNAGTVEFLVTGDKEFYFLEMNTRLQVEHPVTEQVWNIDLVREQINVAQSKSLSVSGASGYGHAIECRVSAEDPYHDFLPATGTLEVYRMPEGPRVRVENGYAEGDRVGIYYDSLLAKIITWGGSRPEAISAMKRAIRETRIVGVKTTLDFCQFVLGHEEFESARFNTTFVQKYFINARRTSAPEHLAEAAVAGLSFYLENRQNPPAAVNDRSNGSRWKQKRTEEYNS